MKRSSSRTKAPWTRSAVKSAVKMLGAYGKSIERGEINAIMVAYTTPDGCVDNGWIHDEKTANTHLMIGCAAQLLTDLTKAKRQEVRK